jgi:hypothetical protein
MFIEEGAPVSLWSRDKKLKLNDNNNNNNNNNNNEKKE